MKITAHGDKLTRLTPVGSRVYISTHARHLLHFLYAPSSISRRLPRRNRHRKRVVSGAIYHPKKKLYIFSGQYEMWPDGKISGINLIDCACSITSLESLLHALREAVNHRRDECGAAELCPFCKIAMWSVAKSRANRFVERRNGN
jgi:hypothetical protein